MYHVVQPSPMESWQNALDAEAHKPWDKLCVAIPLPPKCLATASLPPMVHSVVSMANEMEK